VLFLIFFIHYKESRSHHYIIGPITTAHTTTFMAKKHQTFFVTRFFDYIIGVAVRTLLMCNPNILEYNLLHFHFVNTIIIITPRSSRQQLCKNLMKTPAGSFGALPHRTPFFPSRPQARRPRRNNPHGEEWRPFFFHIRKINFFAVSTIFFQLHECTP